MNIILCGYHWSGCEALKQLLRNKHKVFVYTHKNKYYEPSLVDYCKKKKINYSLKKISLSNIPFKIDIIASVSYKYKIPDNVIKKANFKGFNLHPSLLPKYKGCSSLTWAMINNEKFAGFTYHYLTNKFDSGKIILQKKIEINEFDLQINLFYRVMEASLKFLPQVIKLVKAKYRGKSQIGKGSYFKRGAPYDGILNPKWSYNKQERFVRSMIFPPLSVAKYKNKKIKNISEL